VKGGVTCVACHDAHTPDVDRHAALAPSNNGLCTRCHQAIGARLSEHTRHPAESAGSSCVECHMPKTVTSIKATMRDHTIGLPVPENTVAYGIPNACTSCHTTQRAQWAVDRLRSWWPEGRRQRYVRQAQAFTAARRGRPEAVAPLLAIAADAETPPIVRANALGHLGRADDARATAALVAGLGSSHAVERMVAASSLRSPATRQEVLRGLDDPRRAVRIAALISLANTPGGSLGPDERSAFARVTREFAARARLHEDDAGVQTDLGLVQLLAGDHAQAARALEISLSLEPALPKATLLLGLVRAGQGRLDEARSLLARVPPSDPGYRLAQDQLRALAGRQ
jgi:predicted CXXCH cytochrome family protein